MDDHRATSLIAQGFFRRLWTVANRREQALAPRAGFESTASRIGDILRRNRGLVLDCLKWIQPQAAIMLPIVFLRRISLVSFHTNY